MASSNCVLVVPGYLITPGTGVGSDQFCLSSPVAALCDRVVAVHSGYSKILLLGGWDSPLLPASTTIAEAMRATLMTRGIPSEKIALIDDENNQRKCWIRRDSAEEAQAFFYWRAFYSDNKPPYTFLVMAPWAGRVKIIHKYLGLEMNAIEVVPMPVGAKLSLPTRLSLLVAEWISRGDPLGTKTLLGRQLFRRNRQKRSFAPPPSGKRWIIR